MDLNIYVGKGDKICKTETVFFLIKENYSKLDKRLLSLLLILMLQKKKKQSNKKENNKR